MARIFSSLALLCGLFHGALVSGDELALGTVGNIEDRQGVSWGYIPNYADKKCDDFISYGADKLIVYGEGGAKGVGATNAAASCCGTNAAAGQQACGPEFWPFVDLPVAEGENSFFRCQSSNTKISATKDNNQQTPINIQTRTSFDNTAISFKDIATIDGTDPYPATAGRTPTGFSFARRQDATPRFSAREACPAKIQLLAGTFEVTLDSTDTCRQTVLIGNKTFELIQFHLHSAEHTVNGAYFPLEVHFVHFEVVDGKADSSRPLVLAAFLSAGGQDKSIFTSLIRDFTAKAAVTKVQPYKLLNSIKNSYWHYIGSLTTPPCQTTDKGYVRWFVFKKPIVVSLSQVQFFTSYFNVLKKSYNGQNNRPVQRLLTSTQVYSYGPEPIKASF